MTITGAIFPAGNTVRGEPGSNLLMRFIEHPAGLLSGTATNDNNIRLFLSKPAVPELFHL